MTDTETAEQQDTETNERVVYELGFHVVPTVTEEELPAAVGRIKEVLEQRGATVLAEEFPQRMHLAYTMEKADAGKRSRFDTAYFGWVKFELEPENAQSANETYRAMPELLRFILIKTTRESAASSRQIRKPVAEGESAEERGEVSQAELDKTIDALVKED